jgi:hypothetical protein
VQILNPQPLRYLHAAALDLDHDVLAHRGVEDLVEWRTSSRARR